jgi:DUF971 family protein
MVTAVPGGRSSPYNAAEFVAMTPHDELRLTPRSLKSDGEALLIEWADGVTHRLPWSLLRKACPCATCRTQREEPPAALNVLKPEEAVPPRPKRMQPMGNYAYHIEFTDGHNTGIYSLEYLRALGEALP